MNIALIFGIVIALSAQSLAIQAIGLLVAGVAIFIIDSRCWK